MGKAQCSSGVSSGVASEVAQAGHSDPRLSFATILFVVAIGISSALGQNDVLTQHNDAGRTGLNGNETLLSPANVNATQFGKLFTQNVDGIIVGQPLYASRVLMNDGLVHNVVYVATQHNSVYAFDADNNQANNAAPLWSVSLNGGGTSDPISDYGCTGTHFTEIGITGTPVIDSAKTTLYVVAKTLNGTTRNFSLHALDITNGNEMLGGPVVITGPAPSSSGTVIFNPLYQLQRPALLLENGLIYVAFGGNGCDDYVYDGWLFAYDNQALGQQAVFAVAPNGKKGAIWQGGSGPAADESGNIYFATGNGTYDGPEIKDDYGDSVVKMGWNAGAFGVIDYFTPYNQAALFQQDLDLGSAGVLILPDQPGAYPHELIAGGKQGTLYLINRDLEGEFNVDADDVVESIPEAVAGELDGIPSYWNGNVYLAGDGDYIKQFPLVEGALSPEPSSQTNVLFGGAGPASTSISANGDANGILWALGHSNNILYAFDATKLASMLYNSAQAAKQRDKLSPLIRFATPTISNGKVYIGGKSTLTVYGLLPSLSDAAGNNQAGSPKEVLPVGLSVLASDAYAGAPVPGLSVTCKDGGAGGVFTPGATTTTDATGMATFRYQLPGTPKAITITCSNLAAGGTIFAESCVPGTPAGLTKISGNNQSAAPNTQLALPLVVKVTDGKGFAVPGVAVSFGDNGAGGSFSNPAPVTASNGEASTLYTTGATAGSVTVKASVSGVNPASFQATVTPQ